MHASTSMCTKWGGMRSMRTSQPSASSHALTWRAAGSWVRSSPLPITATPGSTIMKSPPSKRAGGDQLAQRHLARLVEADHRRVLAAPPPLGGLGDDRARRGHDARVAREHLVGEGGVGLEEVAAHAGLLVDRDQLGVLAPRLLGIEAAAAVERRARDRARRAASGSCRAGRAGRRAGARTRSRRPTAAARRVVSLRHDPFLGLDDSASLPARAAARTCRVVAQVTLTSNAPS